MPDEEYEPTLAEQSDPDSPFYHGDFTEHNVWYTGGVL